MDSRLVSYTTILNRHTSKTYLDLVACNSRSFSSVDCSSCRMEGHNKRRKQHPSPRPHIGIIGAGVAGLRCADVLLQYGFQVTILEGRDRVGGRMHQVYLPNTNYLVDTGPNWIHGTDDNVILDLAKETHTSTHSWGESFNAFDEHGHFIPEQETAEYNNIMWTVVGEAFKYSNEKGASIPASQSLYDFFINRLEEHLPVTEKDNVKKTRTLLQMSKMWGAFIGSTIEKQSLKCFWLEETLGGENLFCAQTYQQILKKIAQPALQRASIKLSTTAQSINSSDENEKIVTIKSNRGESFVFDEVVVTAPLGWLKKNKNAFSPHLPHRLSAAIDSIGYGALEKVFINFPQAFWLSSYHQQPSSPMPTNLQNSSRRDSKGFNQFLYPRYSPRNPHHWIVECLELGSLPSDSAQPTLLFYISDAQSQAIVGEISKIPSQFDQHNLLVDIFYPYFSRLAGFSDSNPDCVPASCYVTRWLMDDLAGNGSYSNFEVGLEEGDKDIEAMREGMPERGVWLAGEHTAPFIASGTVTGAYWSGEAVGRRIAQAYGMGTDGRNGPLELDVDAKNRG